MSKEIRSAQHSHRAVSYTSNTPIVPSNMSANRAQNHPPINKSTKNHISLRLDSFTSKVRNTSQGAAIVSTSPKHLSSTQATHWNSRCGGKKEISSRNSTCRCSGQGCSNSCGCRGGGEEEKATFLSTLRPLFNGAPLNCFDHDDAIAIEFKSDKSDELSNWTSGVLVARKPGTNKYLAITAGHGATFTNGKPFAAFYGNCHLRRPAKILLPTGNQWIHPGIKCSDRNAPYDIMAIEFEYTGGRFNLDPAKSDDLRFTPILPPELEPDVIPDEIPYYGWGPAGPGPYFDKSLRKCVFPVDRRYDASLLPPLFKHNAPGNGGCYAVEGDSGSPGYIQICNGPHCIEYVYSILTRSDRLDNPYAIRVSPFANEIAEFWRDPSAPQRKFDCTHCSQNGVPQATPAGTGCDPKLCTDKGILVPMGWRCEFCQGHLTTIRNGEKCLKCGARNDLELITANATECCQGRTPYDPATHYCTLCRAGSCSSPARPTVLAKGSRCGVTGCP